MFIFVGLLADCSLTLSSLKGRPIVTQIAKAGPFYQAEDYHQNYCVLKYTLFDHGNQTS